MTIPALLPPQGHNYTQGLYTPFQSMGARGVNNLAAKLLLALLPPNTPFFRLVMDDYSREKLMSSAALLGDVEKALSKYERAVQAELERAAIRTSSFEALKHLIVAGNCLMHHLSDGGVRVFKLTDYVVQRDPSGNVLEILIKEVIAPAALPSEIRKVYEQQKGSGSEHASPEKSLDLYTWVRLEGGNWRVHQEVNGIKVPESISTYPRDKTPFMPLRWMKIDGEDYGRGHAEEYLGDLVSLEGLSQAIVEGAAAAARILIMVKPGTATLQSAVAKAANGAVITGDSNDVSVLQMEKYADFRVAREMIGEIETRLAFAFLLNTSIQRAGERVTAEEIRYMARELEDTIGGVYSVLSQEFQLPLVHRLVAHLERKGKLPVLPKGVVKPAIITGMEALGRGHDLSKLQLAMQTITETLGPEIIARYINPAEYIARALAAVGVTEDGLIRSAEEVAQAEQAAQMQQMLAKLGPNAVNQLGGMAKTQMENQQNEQVPEGGSPQG